MSQSLASTMPLLSGAPPAVAAPVWGPEHPVQLPTGGCQSAAYDLRRTVGEDGRTVLHVLGRVTDECSSRGLVYARSLDGGTTWRSGKRLNATTANDGPGTLATSGRRVYAAWADHALYFRSNTSHGAAAAWSRQRRVSSTSHRFGRPAVAASGSSVYVAVTDMRSGKLRLYWSHDRGASWSRRSLATTWRASEVWEGPSVEVVATGRTVLVSWSGHSGTGRVYYRLSRTSGSSWSTARSLGVGELSSVAATGRRIAVAAGSSSGPWVRERVAGSWRPRQALPTGGSVARVHPLVALRGSSQLGVCFSIVPVKQVEYEVLPAWSQSGDHGRTWTTPSLLRQHGTAGASGVVWRSTGELWVMTTSWTWGDDGSSSAIRQRIG